MYVKRAIGTIFFLLALLALLALLGLSAFGAQAHFLLNLNVRIIHVEHVNDGLRVYVRLPMPYLVADKLGDVTKVKFGLRTAVRCALVEDRLL